MIAHNPIHLAKIAPKPAYFPKKWKKIFGRYDNYRSFALRYSSYLGTALFE
jgi:hypothetical protein